MTYLHQPPKPQATGSNPVGRTNLADIPCHLLSRARETCQFGRSGTDFWGGRSLSSGFDLEKLVRYVERPPSIQRHDAWRILASFRGHCLRQGDNPIIDPAVRNARVSFGDLAAAAVLVGYVKAEAISLNATRVDSAYQHY